MSLESAIEQLAYAVIRKDENSAVAEIIRQREAAKDEAARWKRDADWYQQARDRHYKELQTSRRQVAALRGVIKRMKAKPVAQIESREGSYE